MRFWLSHMVYKKCKYWIVLSGDNGIEIPGIKGLSLKEVNYETAKKHKGLKYWIVYDKWFGIDDTYLLRNMANQAREDIMNLILGKRLRGVKEIKL